MFGNSNFLVTPANFSILQFISSIIKAPPANFVKKPPKAIINIPNILCNSLKFLTSAFIALDNFKIASRELYDSYLKPPLPPSQFINPQIVLNSDRIVINAKSDHILMSSQKSIGLSTLGSVNIDAPKGHYISSNDIRLGSTRADQPVLLGDNTVDVLIQLTGAVKDLAKILQVQQDWPGGELKTSFNSIAGNVIEQIDNASGILAQLNNNSLKSKTTKVQ